MNIADFKEKELSNIEETLAEEIAMLRKERTREFNERLQINGELIAKLAISESKRAKLREAIQRAENERNLSGSNRVSIIMWGLVLEALAADAAGGSE